MGNFLNDLINLLGIKKNDADEDLDIEDDEE
jgi:hypothetical protein